MRKIMTPEEKQAKLNKELLDAARNGHTEIANALINARADLDVKDNVGKTPLNWAAEKGHTEIANALINAAELNKKLLDAARNGRTEIANALINAGANVNTQGESRRTPLHYAAIKGHTEIVKAIIAAGAKIEEKDINGETSGTFKSHEGR